MTTPRTRKQILWIDHATEQSKRSLDEVVESIREELPHMDIYFTGYWTNNAIKGKRFYSEHEQQIQSNTYDLLIINPSSEATDKIMPLCEFVEHAYHHIPVIIVSSATESQLKQFYELEQGEQYTAHISLIALHNSRHEKTNKSPLAELIEKYVG